MADRQLNRVASLTIAKPFAGEFFTAEPNAIVISNIRVMFSITKAHKAEPNDCNVSIYNLNKQSRAAFQKKPLKITLDVGYDKQLSRIFTGDLRYGSSHQEGTDWVTKLQLGDGDRAFNHATVNRTHPANVDRLTLLREAAHAAGMRIPTSIESAKEMLDQFAQGMTLNGSAARAITSILAPKGMQWSIQDGEMQILRNEETRAENAIPINAKDAKARMIGSPEMAPPVKNGKPPKLNIKCLLCSDIRPGGRILVSSTDVNGLFRVEKVTHDGDTFGGDWTSSIEAVAM